MTLYYYNFQLKLFVDFVTSMKQYPGVRILNLFFKKKYYFPLI